VKSDVLEIVEITMIVVKKTFQLLSTGVQAAIVETDQIVD
jgi:hypothetical protein